MSVKIPPETTPKKKRAPRGTFDRNKYMRELMRERNKQARVVFRSPKISITIGGVSV